MQKQQATMKTVMNYTLQLAGGDKTGKSWEVSIPSTGQFAGIVSERYGKSVRVWFNGSATRGSQRKFASVDEAVKFIHDRRVKKGWTVA